MITGLIRKIDIMLGENIMINKHVPNIAISIMSENIKFDAMSGLKILIDDNVGPKNTDDTITRLNKTIDVKNIKVDVILERNGKIGVSPGLMFCWLLA